jgi:hypothetical protein
MRPIAAAILAIPTLAFAADKSVYLSDLEWASAQNLYHSRGPQKDRSWTAEKTEDGAPVAAQPLRLGGKTYDKGLGCMPGWSKPQTITYDLSKKYTRFTAVVGIDDRATEETEGYEWVIVHKDGSIQRPTPYRGCAPAGKKTKTEGCFPEDSKVPYWPGASDVGNKWVDYFLKEVPGKTLVMTRPACSVAVLVDGKRVWGMDLEQSAGRNTGARKIDIPVRGAQTLTLEMNASGTQHHPIASGTRVNDCPWRDLVNWADAKLHVASPTRR